jgi:hypothetical protein
MDRNRRHISPGISLHPNIATQSEHRTLMSDVVTTTAEIASAKQRHNCSLQQQKASKTTIFLQN